MKAIVQVDEQWGIGRDNSLMFSLPADMKFFKNTTTGNVVVMGANTLKSFPGGKPLKNRTNIVLSKSLPESDDRITVRSREQLMSELKKYPSDSVYVIGGALIYSMLLPYCECVLVTKVNAVGGADRFFCDLDKSSRFSLVETSQPVETNGYTITFNKYINHDLQPLE